MRAAYSIATATITDRRCSVDKVPFAVHWMVYAAAAAAAAVASTACRAADVCIELPVSLEDEFFGRVKKVVISVARWDNATSALAKTTHTLFVQLSSNKSEHVFIGAGDDPPVPWLMVMRQVLPGCAIKGRGSVRLSIKRLPHAVLYIDNVLCSNDLHADVEVTPFDHYYGKEVCIEHFDGLPPVIINYSRKIGSVHIERGRGMLFGADNERGDLHVFFEMRLPDVPSEHLTSPGMREAMALLFARDPASKT